MKRRMNIYFVCIAFIAILAISTNALAASTTKANLDQCGNGPLSTPVYCNDGNWINGNLNGNQAHYLEGDSVPYRLVITDLSAGTHGVTIEWDTLKSGKHAIDYITTYNRTERINDDPCANTGFSCSGPNTTIPIPIDPNARNQIPGVLTLFGGTITGVSGYAVTGADNSTSITITFTNTVSNPNLVLAWGGHISTRLDWGIGNSSVSIPGSPFHMRLIALDGSGGNQDRSLANAAVIFPGQITIIKDASPSNTATIFNYLASPSPLQNFDLTSTNPSKIFDNITSFVTYTVAEQATTGWDFVGINCSEIDPGAGGGSTSNVGSTLTINLVEGNAVQCTFANQRQQSILTVIKHVINNDGGINTASDFTMSVTGTNAVPSTFQGSESGTSVALDPIPGTYNVTETGPSGYTSTFSADCSGSISSGQNKTCTVTNDDNQPKLIVIKHVINDDGGSATASDFTINVNAENATPSTFQGSETGTTITLNAGSYSVNETGPTGYSPTLSSDCSGTLALGETKTCTIINDDIQPQLTVIKHVINDDGGINVSSDFTISVSGTNVTPSTFQGSESGTTISLNAGVYNVTETGPFGYAPSLSIDCSGTLNVGDKKTCTITNDDERRHLSFVKSGSLNITGDSIDYNINVTNDGSVILHISSITDPNIALTCIPSTFPTDLNPGDSIICTGSYPTGVVINATTIIQITDPDRTLYI